MGFHIASANDGGTMVVFDSTGDHHGSKLIKADSEEGREIRRLVAKARATEMRRIKNTYFARLWGRRRG